jgi:hypothetical protein
LKYRLSESPKNQIVFESFSSSGISKTKVYVVLLYDRVESARCLVSGTIAPVSQREKVLTVITRISAILFCFVPDFEE